MVKNLGQTLTLYWTFVLHVLLHKLNVVGVFIARILKFTCHNFYILNTNVVNQTVRDMKFDMLSTLFFHIWCSKVFFK